MDFIRHKPHNVAAWILKANQRPVVVSSAPYTSPPKGHVVIRLIDVAINPIDWKIQDAKHPIFKMDYPTILGKDVAGFIVEVADDVHDFRMGQRVIACVDSYGSNDPTQGAFQRYVITPAVTVAELPYSIPTSIGVVLPLGITTAAAGLYEQDNLALPLPSASRSATALNRTVLLWGGSSSVGSGVIQLAVASGAEVITTASPANFEYCCKLGASQCFDYHTDDVEDQIVKALEGKTVAGAYDAVGAVLQCARVLDRVEGKAVVVTVGGSAEGVPDSVRVKQISANSIFESDIGAAIWRDFLPKALENGVVLPKPDARIVGEGLRSVQAGLDAQRKGVSATKIVVANIP